MMPLTQELIVEQADPVTGLFPLNDADFNEIRKFILDHLGISLCPAKKDMVAGRLRNRLKHHGLTSYGEYFKLVQMNLLPGEQQEIFDCITTNETFFFREKAHFDFLCESVFPLFQCRKDIRIWSAASSSGEEVYSLAMMLASYFGLTGWELVGSDINRHVLAQAQRGHYPLQRNEGIPEQLLSRYCLKGTGRYEGTFLIKKNLREKVQFKQINLKDALPAQGKFDVIFLRNIMIYFDKEAKAEIVKNVLRQLNRGGFLIIGHSENLHDLESGLEMLKPSIFTKPM